MDTKGKILDIIKDVCDTSIYIHKKIGGHHDLKLKNIKNSNEEGHRKDHREKHRRDLVSVN